jgi:hypothetical protein
LQFNARQLWTHGYLLMGPHPLNYFNLANLSGMERDKLMRYGVLMLLSASSLLLKRSDQPICRLVVYRHGVSDLFFGPFGPLSGFIVPTTVIVETRHQACYAIGLRKFNRLHLDNQ